MTDVVTGPPYPPGPAFGSNAIGVMTIGGSQIGGLDPFDWRATLMSQYANSPILSALIESFYDAANLIEALDEFFDDIWNVYTAQGVGLDDWGTIVGVNRVLAVGTPTKYLGFDEGGTLDYDPFNQSPWYKGQKLTTNYVLSDDGFRTLIIAKALSNISDGSIPSINQILRTLFGARGKCYCTDEGGMAMTYTFEFVPSQVDIAIVTNSGVMPTPTGVAFTIVYPT